MASVNGQQAGRRDYHEVNLDMSPNESSALLRVDNPAVLEAHGWDVGFWTGLDDGRVENCVALIGRSANASSPTEGWQTSRLQAHPLSRTGKTEDIESVTRHDGWVYAIGSLFGSKSGPLQEKRQFMARFREADVDSSSGRDVVDMSVVEDEFRLHRLLNDGLRRSGADLIARGPKLREKFIKDAREEAIEEGEDWFWRIHWDDYPINVEGATFRPDGSMLLGLRFPTTADGHPVVVEVTGITHLFEGGGSPQVAGVWSFPDIGGPDKLVGVRDMHAHGDEVHLLVGNLDSDYEGVILTDYPEGGGAFSAHWVAQLPENAHGGDVAASLIEFFDGIYRMEGLAADLSGHYFYVSDEDDYVHTRFAVTDEG
jgi:hypothetical protein